MREGDPIASGVWGAGVAALAHVLAAAVATLDVEVLVIGGGLGRPVKRSPLRSPRRWRRNFRGASCHASSTPRFAADAGFVGAALEAWRLAAGRDVAELAGAIESTEWDRSDEVVG